MFYPVLIGIMIFLIFLILADIYTRVKFNQPLFLFSKKKGLHNTKSAGHLAPGNKISVVISIKKQWQKITGGMGKKQVLISLTVACSVIFMVSFLILQSFWLALFLGLGGVLAPYMLMKQKRKKWEQTLSWQFKEALESISTSLRAGRSMISAFEQCLEDMQQVFGVHKKQPIVEELEKIVQDIRTGSSLEEALIAFRDRVNLEDVHDFVDATLITQKKGGNLTEVIANVSKVIAEKINIKREILTLTASKRAEANILVAAPLLIVIILVLFSPEYMAPMYDSLGGQIAMMIGIIFIGLAVIIGRKIVEIDI